VLAEGTIDEIKANEQVIEAYLGTGLKNKDQLAETATHDRDPYQDDRGNKDRSITQGRRRRCAPPPARRRPTLRRGFPDRRHHVGRLRRGAGYPA
jgi:hypothetical protein